MKRLTWNNQGMKSGFCNGRWKVIGILRFYSRSWARRRAVFEAAGCDIAGTRVRSGFVADGDERAWAGVEAEIRAEVEEKYAQEWNSSGIIKRWQMQQYIEQETAARVSERLEHISEKSLF